MRNGYWTRRGFVANAVAELTPEGLSAPEPLAGTYVAWLLDRASGRAINGWCRLMGIPDPVPADEMHATVMMSPDDSVPEDEHGDHPLRIPYTTGPWCKRATDILGRAGMPGALVARVDSPVLQARHLYWREERGLRHGSPDFLPHVTLSYDAGSVSPEVRRRLFDNPMPLPITFDRERVAWCNH